MIRLRRVIGGVLVVAAAALAVAVVVVNAVAAGRGAQDSKTAWEAAPFVLAVLAPACVGLYVVLRRPTAWVAWILIAGAFSVAVVMTGDAVAGLALHGDSGSRVGAWAALVQAEWPVFFLWPLAIAYVFPDGRLPSPRWRPLAALAGVSSAGVVVLLFLAPELESSYGRVPSPLPFTLDEERWLPVFWACWGGLLVALFGGAGALLARYRAGGPVERRQVLWLAYGALLLPLWLGVGTLWTELIGPIDSAVFNLGLMTVQVWPAVAIAVAVTRHGLYSIDRLLNRTVVYLALTVLLVGTYALVAVLAGTVVGGSSFSASVATLAVAVAFGPLRSRIQEQVDRRFAPARFEAIRLLREFVDDIREGRAEPEHIGRVAALALADPAAEILFRLPETGAYADWQGRVVNRLPEDGRARALIGGKEREIGVLLHSAAPDCGADLLRDVLQAAAVPAEMARLRVELRLQLVEVESSRARIAHAGYEERRRIERDLHDGAQQRLVTLGIVLRRMQRSLPRDARVLGPALDGAVDEVAAAIADLRTLAAGVRPPRLDEGLSAALADLARGAGVPVEVQATADRAPRDLEAAAYFVACEAITNAVKHASATHVVVRSAREDGELQLLVADDGIGGAAPSSGTGLRGMLDRVAAHGGTVSIDSPPGSGTRVLARFPCGS